MRKVVRRRSAVGLGNNLFSLGISLPALINSSQSPAAPIANIYLMYAPKVVGGLSFYNKILLIAGNDSKILSWPRACAAARGPIERHWRGNMRGITEKCRGRAGVLKRGHHRGMASALPVMLTIRDDISANVSGG